MTMPAPTTLPPHVAALLEAARADPNVVVVSQDMGNAWGFADEFPDRFFDVGISEANLIGVAAGLAHSGKNAVAMGMAPFLTMRAFEQIRDDCAYNENPVTIIGSFTGLEAGPWGVTHHAQEDIALMRTIPGMTVVAPADIVEAGRAITAAVHHPGTAYVRLAGFAADMSPIADLEPRFDLGVANELRAGNDLTIIATGTLVRMALRAAEGLARSGIEAAVINMHTVKPLDREAVERAAASSERILTVEEHSVIGGLGAAVAECVAEAGRGRVRRVGVPDCFCTEVEPYGHLLARYGMDAAGVEAAARELLAD
jgi:transketolase